MRNVWRTAIILPRWTATLEKIQQYINKIDACVDFYKVQM